MNKTMLFVCLMCPFSLLAQTTVNVSTEPKGPTFSMPVSDEWDITPNITIPIIDGTNQIGTGRIIATPELSLVIVTNSASPQRLKSVQMADIVAKAAARKAKVADIKAKAAAANSVPALREEVRRIAELLESN